MLFIYAALVGYWHTHPSFVEKAIVDMRVPVAKRTFKYWWSGNAGFSDEDKRFTSGYGHGLPLFMTGRNPATSHKWKYETWKKENGSDNSTKVEESEEKNEIWLDLSGAKF